MSRFHTTFNVLSLICDRCGRYWVQFGRGEAGVKEVVRTKGWLLLDGLTLCYSCAASRDTPQELQAAGIARQKGESNG
jgi:hypothetical protein